MNKSPSSYRRFVVVLLWLLVICLAVHFFHDIQPGRVDLVGNVARVCCNVIHSGVLAGVIPTIVLAVLALELLLFPSLFLHSGYLSVPVHPPQ